MFLPGVFVPRAAAKAQATHSFSVWVSEDSRHRRGGHSQGWVCILIILAGPFENFPIIQAQCNPNVVIFKAAVQK